MQRYRKLDLPSIQCISVVMSINQIPRFDFCSDLM